MAAGVGGMVAGVEGMVAEVGRVRVEMDGMEMDGNPQTMGGKKTRIAGPEVPLTGTSSVVPFPLPMFANNTSVLCYDSQNTKEILKIEDTITQQKEYTTFQQWAQSHMKMGEIMRGIATVDRAVMVNSIDWNMWRHHQR